MLIQKNGKWVFVSKKTQRPLAYYRGEGKPPDEWVRKQEQCVHHFNHLDEAAYVGNIGFQELVKFHSKSTPSQKKELQTYIQNKKHKEFRDLIKQVTGVKLHKSVNEKNDSNKFLVAGAGQWGTLELTKKYLKNTPGQKIASFLKYVRYK